MVLIPGGEFRMGDDSGEDDEQPAHMVRVGSFYMDVCEVTQESFQLMMGRNPSKWQDPAKPVERMSWYLAIQYCNMRSTREGFQPCYDLETLFCDFWRMDIGYPPRQNGSTRAGQEPRRATRSVTIRAS